MTRPDFPALTLPVAVTAQPKFAISSQILFINLLLSPLIFVVSLSFGTADKPANGWIFFIVFELLLNMFLMFGLATMAMRPRVQHPWDLVLTPYQLSLQNGALPTHLLESVEYQPKNFFHTDSLILKYYEAGVLVSIKLELEQPEAVYQQLCREINAYLAKHRTLIDRVAQEPLSRVAQHLSLPERSRFYLSQKPDYLEVLVPDLTALETYPQTILMRPGSASGRSRRIRLKPEFLEVDQEVIHWQDLKSVRIDVIMKYDSTSETSFPWHVMSLHWTGYSLEIADVRERAGLRHQLAWLQDLIWRQRSEALASNRP